MNISTGLILKGDDAFYKKSDYQAVTQTEMALSKPLRKTTYTHNTENKIWRIVKDIFSIIIFPIGLYRLVHALVGKILVPASSPFLLGYESDYSRKSRMQIDSNSEWKVKRISIKVDGYIIDAAIMGRPSTLDKDRWVLASNGNGEFFENKLQDNNFKHVLSKLDGNAIVFNYPGVGASSGMPNRRAMAKAYRAMLNFLEDKDNGLGAKEIIGYGHSIGGGVQGDALRSHQLKQDTKYVFVKSRTFSDLSTTASHLTNRLLGFLVKVFGWNISSVESSKKLNAPEIIMQTARVLDYTDISDQPDLIVHDGVIPAEASLAKKLLDVKPSLANKYFLGIPEGHNDLLRDPKNLVGKINEML